MQVGDDGRHGKFPLEANGQIKHDADHHKGQRLEAVFGQLVPHLRADKLGTAQCDIRVIGFQGGQNLVALLRRAHTLLRRQTDQHITGRAEVLHLHFTKAQRAHRASDLLQVGRLAVTDFHQGAARELHRQVQTTAK